MTSSTPPAQDPTYDLFGVIAFAVLLGGGALAVLWFLFGVWITVGIGLAATQLTLMVLILLALRELVSEVRLQRLTSQTMPRRAAPADRSAD